MNAVVNPIEGGELKRRIVAFMRGASTEIAPHDEEIVPQLVGKLPADTMIYVAHTPKATLQDVVRLAIKVESLGFRACPHIVARRIESERALREGLQQAREGGVEHLLLVAGDRDPPAGKFTSTLEILDSGATVDAGFKALGVAGHPEGHKAVGPSTLWSALRHKQDFADRTGTKMRIVTQFGFNPDAICAWDRHLAEHGISLPVHVGIAGPTPLQKLIKYAMACGVGASLNSLMKNMSAMANLARLATSPDEMLVGLIRGCVASGPTRIVRPHFFAFGGVVATARWMRAVADGNFELPPQRGKFIMDA